MPIAIIRDRQVCRIAAPEGTGIFNGDRALDVGFDIVSLCHVRNSGSAMASSLAPGGYFPSSKVVHGPGLLRGVPGRASPAGVVSGG